MAESTNFHDKSYELHEDHYSDYGEGGAMEQHAKTWCNLGTVDAWRHQRMYQSLDPLINTNPDAKWLTIGDGRFGNDAKYIYDKKGDVVATDISDTLLKEAHGKGYIGKYKKENAEALSFNDNQFDYVFCKESFHHFPRPWLALYEMIRVANKAVILIEPNDVFIYGSDGKVFFRMFKRILFTLLGKKEVRHDFEDSGNYKYAISRREIEKIALGVNFKVVAFKGINDVFLPGVEKENYSDHGPMRQKLEKKINLLNRLCKIGLTDYNIISTIIFKEKPSPDLIEQLKKDQYQVVFLPENPYV